MQTFALGQRCIRQRRGSPMGSPLSPALCLMGVSMSEQIGPLTSNRYFPTITFSSNTSATLTINSFSVMPAFKTYHQMKSSWMKVSMESRPSWKPNPIKSFMLETKPLELIYNGPTNISQSVTHIHHPQQLVPHQQSQPTPSTPNPPLHQPTTTPAPVQPEPPTPTLTTPSQPPISPSFNPEEMLNQMKQALRDDLAAAVEKANE